MFRYIVFIGDRMKRIPEVSWLSFVVRGNNKNNTLLILTAVSVTIFYILQLRGALNLLYDIRYLILFSKSAVMLERVF